MTLNLHAPRQPAGLRILLIDTNRSAVGPRLALSLLALGCTVGFVCPPQGHPAQALAPSIALFPYRGLRPLASLEAAIAAFAPDFLLPLCERSVIHLHGLHELGDSAMKARIEASLGPASSFAIAGSRYRLLQLAREHGILIPDMVALDEPVSPGARGALDEGARVWMIKADGTSGGRGVRPVSNSHDAARARRLVSRRSGALTLAKQMILNRDRGTLLWDRRQPTPSLLAQAFIHGRPANCAVACWHGRVLSGLAVEVVATQSLRGPSTIVEIVPGDAMMQAAHILVGQLSLTGLIGFDFMVEQGTGSTYLIEMNPRCTPICTLALGTGRNLPAALWAALAGVEEPVTFPVTTRSRIAFFPQPKAVFAPGSAHEPYYDVPQGVPALIRALLHPWPERTWAGRCVDFVRKLRRSREWASSYTQVYPANAPRLDPDLS